MKFSIDYNRENNDIPMMNIEFDDSNIYQLYVDNDASIHLVENLSKEYISSNNLYDCINDINLSNTLDDKEKIYIQNILIYGSLYEVLLKSRIYEKFDDIEMRFLSVFLYRGLDYQCIKYIQQCDYCQLYFEVLAEVNSFSKEDLDTELSSIQLDGFPFDGFYFSEELQRIYLMTDTNKHYVYFDYSKYFDESSKNNCFFSCFIYVLLIYYYPNDALFLLSL